MVSTIKRKGNFYHKIYDMDNLREAHKYARKDKLFYQDVKMVDENPDKYLRRIQKMLKNKTYRVSPYIHKQICDRGKVREIDKLPYYPDRIVQWAVMLQLEDMFENNFIYTTCASRKNKGITMASHMLKKYLKDEENTQYCLRLDVKKFYPSIDREILKKLYRKKIKDKDVLWLLDITVDSLDYVPAEVLLSIDSDPAVLTGLPIGAYLSQYLANFYLSEFDHYVKEQLHCKYYIRYMDDLIILDKSKEHLHNLSKEIEQYLKDNLNLVLNQKKQVFPVEVRGIDFVGFRHFHKYTLLRKTTLKRMKKTLGKILIKVNNSEEINYTDYCACNSYRGWLKWCNSRNLYTKYLAPLEKPLNHYYYTQIKNQGGKVYAQCG